LPIPLRRAPTLAKVPLAAERATLAAQVAWLRVNGLQTKFTSKIRARAEAGVRRVVVLDGMALLHCLPALRDLPDKPFPVSTLP
jgi:hypothetical protein